MYKFWLSLTTVFVATALQSLQMALAANQNLSIVNPLAITEISTTEYLPRLGQRPAAAVSLDNTLVEATAVPSVQPLPTLNSAIANSLDEPASTPAAPATATINTAIVAPVVEAMTVPAVAPLPVLTTTAPTSLDLETKTDTLAAKDSAQKVPGKNVKSPVALPVAKPLPIVAKPLPAVSQAAPTSLDSLDSETAVTNPDKPSVLSTQTGEASWYGPEGGPLTATGERYNPQGLSAAHRTLPFGSKVQVTNLRNNQSVVVRINDRGPFTGGRIIDLSAAAAAEVGIKQSGVGKVRIEVLSYGDGSRKKARR
jgi:rare lipoprotein A